MGIIEIKAFILALPELVKVMGEVVSSLRQLQKDSIDRQLDSIKRDVDDKIKLLILSKTDEERKIALIALAASLGK